MKKFIIFIVCLIVVILLCVVFSNNKKVEENNTTNNTSVENSVIYKNEIVENNTISNSANIDNKVIENEIPVSNNDIYESDSDVGSTNKKQEAIELVKETWGDDNTVSFRCDSVTSNGEYIIAVVSNETRTVKNYFRVNLDKKTVDVDY